MTGKPYRSYVICTAPRSGSTLLCGLLAATHVAGDPDSHFHATSRDAWLADYGLTRDDDASDQQTLRAIFDAAMARGDDGVKDRRP